MAQPPVTICKQVWGAQRQQPSPLDTQIDNVSNLRATIGAGQSRLEQVASNLDTQATNLSSARGRIIDTDFAKETAQLTRTQILQQAGTAMLAQANQIPQGVLSLLKG
jgi:flagellin